jgi:Phage-related minor tail protein
VAAGEREAAIKVNLDSAEFLGELRRMAVDLKKTSEEGKRQFKGIAAGVNAAKSAMSRMADTAKRGLSTVLTLGGAFSFGAAVKGAVELDTRMRALSFRVATATGQMRDSREIQNLLERSATMTGRSTEEMAGAFDTVFSATKNLEYSKSVLGAIGDTATGTGESVETVATVAQQLQRKFGLAATDARDALAQIFEGAQQGGPKFQDFAGVIDLVGAELLQAGVTGKRGLGFLIGALNQADAESGGLQKQVAGLQQFFTKLGNPRQLAAMAKALGIDSRKLLNEKDALKRLDVFLGAGQKGLDTLRAHFIGPEESKQLRILFTDPFEKALNRAKASGLRGKDAVDQALSVLHHGMDEFGKAQLTGADVAKRAAEERERPEARIRAALDRLQQAVAQPETINALNELSALLPGAAKVFGNFLSFAARHPLLAGTLGVGANVGMSFLGGFTRELSRTILSGHMKGGTAAADKLLGGFITGGGKAAGLLAAAGRAFGVAAAALIAYEAGKKLIDAAVDPGLKKTRNVEGRTEAAIANAAGGGSTAMLKERLARLQQAVSAEEQAKLGQDFGGHLESALGGRNVESESIKRVTRGRQAETDLRRRILESEKRDVMRANSMAEAEGGAAPARKVHLEPGAPRAIGVSVADALGGRVLQVRIVNGGTGGAAATAKTFGGRGPLQLPASMHGGGT